MENTRPKTKVKNEMELKQNEKKQVRRRVAITFTEPSLTKQQFAEEVDINNKIKKYVQTGELPNMRYGFYGDVSNLPDYKTAFDMVADAQDAFMELPSEIRAKFNNDPGKVIEFLNDPKNLDEAVRLGIVEGDTSKIGAQPPQEKIIEKEIPKTEIK
jgi:phage internal scaffolding protein